MGQLWFFSSNNERTVLASTDYFDIELERTKSIKHCVYTIIWSIDPWWISFNRIKSIRFYDITNYWTVWKFYIFSKNRKHFENYLQFSPLCNSRCILYLKSYFWTMKRSVDFFSFYLESSSCVYDIHFIRTTKKKTEKSYLFMLLLGTVLTMMMAYLLRREN